jgi:hypothetical protein
MWCVCLFFFFWCTHLTTRKNKIKIKWIKKYIDLMERIVWSLILFSVAYLYHYESILQIPQMNIVLNIHLNLDNLLILIKRVVRLLSRLFISGEITIHFPLRYDYIISGVHFELIKISCVIQILYHLKKSFNYTCPGTLLSSSWTCMFKFSQD